MALTFGTCKTKVADYLHRDDLTSVIPDFINAALRRVEKSEHHNFNYMRKVATGTLTLNSAYLNLPTRYKEVEAFYVQDTDNRQRLLQKTSLRKALVDFPYLTSDYDFPKVFCTDDANSRLILRATPDRAYTYNLYYYQKSAELSDDADTHWLLTNEPEILVYGALLEAEPYLKNSEDDIKVWRDFYIQALADLKKTQVNEKWGGSYQAAHSDYVV